MLSAMAAADECDLPAIHDSMLQVNIQSSGWIACLAAQWHLTTSHLQVRIVAQHSKASSADACQHAHNLPLTQILNYQLRCNSDHSE